MHTKSYQEHLRSSKYCGLQWRILTLKPEFNESHSTDFNKIRVIRERCNSKACPHCAKLRYQKIKTALRKELITDQWRFFTLTSINNEDSLEEKLNRLETHFRELRKKLKRNYPDLKYIKVIELSPSGMWHIHGLWNIYIDIKKLSKYWEEISGAYRCYVEKVRNPRGAIHYIFKYCFKSIFNETERRIIFECDKRKFTTSAGLLNRSKAENPYTDSDRISYSVDELKEKLYSIISSTDFSVDDFSSPDYPYFDDLIFNLFYKLYDEHPPNLFTPQDSRGLASFIN